MATSTLIKKTTNALLDYLMTNKAIPRGFPTDEELVNKLGVSRTTVRKVAQVVFEKGVAIKDGSNKILLRLPRQTDYFKIGDEYVSKTKEVERLIMEKFEAYVIRPNDQFSELELATEFGANTVTVREALLKLSQTGLIEKPPRKKWRVVPLNNKMIDELISLRSMYDIKSIHKICHSGNVPDDHKWIEGTIETFQQCLSEKQIPPKRFAELDKDFYSKLTQVNDNRYIERSYQFTYFIMNYHIWEIRQDQQNIKTSITHSLALAEALVQRDLVASLSKHEAYLGFMERSMKNVNL